MATREELESRLTDAEKRQHEIINDLHGKLELAIKANDILEKRVLELAEENAELKEVSTKLRKELDDNPFLRVFTDFVDERVKKLVGVPASAVIGGTQDLTVVHMKTKIHAKEEHRTLPEVSTLTTRGKIVALIAEGKLDTKKRQAEISKLLPEGIHKLEVMGALNELVKEDILLKIKEDATHVAFMRHPDVEASK